jgi:hypothetical protein
MLDPGNETRCFREHAVCPPSIRPLMKPSTSAAAAIGLLILSVAPLLDAQEVRTWKDKSGRALEGSMVGVDTAAAAVKIKRADGTEVSVPIAMLSAEDTEYAKAKWQQMQSSPAAPPPSGAPATTAAPGASAPIAPTGQPAPPRPELTVTPLVKFKVPAAADYLRTVPRTRPRLIHGKPGWDYLINLVKTDPTATALLTKIKESGEKLLETPELTRIFGEQRSRTTPGSKALFRISTLGTLHMLDQDPRWSDRGVRELVAICDPKSFSDWYPDQPHVTTDFLIAACVAFDWLHSGLNKAQLDTARTCIVNQGILPLVAFLDKKAADKATADLAPDVDTFGAAAALIIAALCINDEDGTNAKKAVGAAAKVFGRGLTRFAPGGVWPEGPDAGEQILDYGIMVLQSLKACSGSDLGFGLLEGFVRTGDARLHLTSPSGQIFNYGDSQAATLFTPWVASWLSGVHGNPGHPAVVAGAAPGPDSSFFALTGYLLYHNPHAAGYGTASALDASFPGAEVATLRSAWNDKNAFYLAIKGGDNSHLHSQLDLGTFILDAGGQRWGIELGMEADRAPGMANPADRARRYANYRQGTLGQNTLTSAAENQPLDAKATISGFVSTPERGAAVIDLKAAYNKETRDYQRGAMLVRGAQTYAIIQDDIGVKGTQTLTWSMHTRAAVAVDGNKAILTQGNQTLTAVILSPAGATFTTEEAPEQLTPLTSLKGVNVLKTQLAGVSGDQRLTVAFALGNEPVQAPVLPITDWVPKR